MLFVTDRSNYDLFSKLFKDYNNIHFGLYFNPQKVVGWIFRPEFRTVLQGWFLFQLLNYERKIIECSYSSRLEYLTTVDQLLIKQKVELLEAFTGFETNNKFTIKNSLGQKVL